MTASPAPHAPPRVAILNKEVMPYRVPLFQALGRRPDLRILVLFAALRDPETKWKIEPGSLTFPHRVLPGICLRPPKSDYSERRAIYINPTLFLELVRFRPEAVVGYEFSVPSLTAWLYSRLARRPFLLWSECTLHSDRHLTRGQREMRKFLVPRAQYFFGTSPAACRNLISFGAPPERVIETPQVHQVNWIARKAGEARGKGAAPESRILFVGSLIQRKGVDLLLEAFLAVAAQRKAAVLRLVGYGPWRKTLERKAAQAGLGDRVEFAGFVQPDDIPAEYAKAAVFVLPSREDTFGVVVVEALASGVPVVCSSFAGASAYLHDGEDAFVIDPTDPARIADRIIRLLDEPALRARFSERGKTIAGTFEAASVAEAFAGGILRAIESERR